MHGYSIRGKGFAIMEKSSDSWSIARHEIQNFLKGGIPTLLALSSDRQYIYVAASIMIWCDNIVHYTSMKCMDTRYAAKALQ